MDKMQISGGWPSRYTAGELLRNGRIEPADEATHKRFRTETRKAWEPAPEPTAAAPGSCLSCGN
jgi:hypothetical protein